ncbi:MAG: chemotaxis protein CheW [Magnetococcus sp. YQC-3]
MPDHAAPSYTEIVDASEAERDREKIVDVDEESVQLLLFRILNTLFAIPGSHVREVMPAGDIFYVPGTSELFLGVVPVRGEIASVLDLSRLLGMAPSSRIHSSRILMVVQEEMSTGVLVDAVEEILTVPVSAIQPHATTLDPQLARLTSGQLLFGQQPTPILEVTALFQYLQEVCR